MKTLRSMWLKLRSLGQRRAVKREIDEELLFHLEQRTADNLAAGMSQEAAAREARKRFGNFQSVREACRDTWGARFGDAMLRDVRYAARQLAKHPGFTAVVVAILALGIGANTAIFSFLDRVLLRPLPVNQPHELVLLKHRSQTGDEGDGFIHPCYVGFREQSQEVFAGLIAYSLSLADLSVASTDSQVPATAVSSDYFSVLGVTPVLGRPFLPEEDRLPGAHPVAIISHRLWKQRFGGDPSVLGKTIRLNDHTLTVVGVAPARFTGTYAGCDPAVYVPLATWAHIKGISLERRVYDWLNLMGRLKPGVSREQAEATLRVTAARIHAVTPENTPTMIVAVDGSRGTNFWTDENLWWPFALVQAVTALVLLVACANVTNLLLLRGITRQREIAIRVAIGASRRHVIRQLMVESTCLALLSGAGGILLAHWLTSLLRGALPLATAASIPVGVDGRVLAFGVLASLATALICGLAPALRVSRPQLTSALNDASGTPTLPGRRWSLRNLMVVIQVALTMIVLAFGALCVRSLEKLRVADPGYDTTRILGAEVKSKRQPGSGFAMRQLFADLQARVKTFPGVAAVCLANDVPLTLEGRNKTGIEGIEGFQMPPDRKWLSLDFSRVGPGYFLTLGVPLLRGRDFTSQDGPGAPKVMIVNELFAQRFWPEQDPIGKRVTLVTNDVREVIGVVRTVKLHSIQMPRCPLMFWPLDQPERFRPPGDVRPVLLVRATGDPTAVAGLVRTEMESAGLGPADCDVRTLPERLSGLFTPQRMMAGILNAVGLVGLLFAATGVFSVVAYEVSRRTREIGIRVALGARWADVRRLILRKGAFFTLVGLGLGTGLSLFPMWLLLAFIPEFRRSDQFFLYGVRAWDPLPYVCSALVVMVAALGACWIAARRAARIQPMEALRTE